MSKTDLISTEKILLMLCESVELVLNSASDAGVSYSPMVQKINKTSLSPDLGCFVLFDGGFSGLVLTNFTGAAAIEIYQGYMLKMGMPKEELATLHTADDVGNILAELMNQILGDFINKVRNQLQTSIQQNQPKMLTINKQVIVSIGTTLDRPQMRKVSFFTKSNHIFYLELAMDKTEFIKLADFDVEESDPDTIIEGVASHSAQAARDPHKASNAGSSSGNNDSDDVLSELGL